MIRPHHSGWLFAAVLPALLAPPLHAQADAQAATGPETTTTRPILPPVSQKNRNAAENLYLKGAKHLSSGSFSLAEDEFAKAVALDPLKPEYLAALALAREHRITDLLQQSAMRRESDSRAADALLAQARAIDPTNPRVTQHDPAAPSATLPGLNVTPVRSTQIAGVIQLRATPGRHSFHERNDIRVLAMHVASAYGIDIRLDPDLPSKTYSIDVDDANFDEAMRVLNLVSDTMFVPLDTGTIVLAADTAPNRTRYERLVEETFYLPGFSADQLKDFVSIAQNVLAVKQVSVQPSLGALVMRGPADLVDAADRIFTDLIKGNSDVVIDLKLYTLDKSVTRNLGVVLPTSFTGYSLAAEAQSIVSQNSSVISQLISAGVIPSSASTVEIAAYLIFVGGISNSVVSNTFLLFGGGITTGGISANLTPTINLALSQSDARMVEDVQLRVGDHGTTTFKSGTRYPIQTSLFSDVASSTTSALSGITVNGTSLSSLLAQYLGTSSINSSAVIPQVQYEDLGLVVTAAPTVLITNDVGMHLEVKVSALAGSALNGIPILTSRQFSSDLTIANGQTAMMVSNATESEISSVSGVPGLSELPGFQSTSNKNVTKTTGELVLLITPHIVRRAHTSPNGPYIPLAPRPDSE